MHLLPIKVLIASTCLSLAMSHHASLADVGSRVVQTDKGPVRGKVEDGVIKFKGIPYAAPPMGDLRWELPQEPAAWTEVLDATQFRSACPQEARYGLTEASSDEDCLYLNATVPTSNKTEKSGRSSYGFMAARSSAGRARSTGLIAWPARGMSSSFR
jgi:para-nitrobenzyl esterase